MSIENQIEKHFNDALASVDQLSAGRPKYAMPILKDMQHCIDARIKLLEENKNGRSGG